MARRTCVRYKRVRSRFGGTVRRCAKYGRARRKASASRRKSTYKRRRTTARKTRTCVRFGRNRNGVRVCRKYTRTASGGYRRGHRPFNKGRKCVAWKRTAAGRKCASFGGARSRRTPWRSRSRTPNPRYRGGEVIDTTAVEIETRKSRMLPAEGSPIGLGPAWGR